MSSEMDHGQCFTAVLCINPFPIRAANICMHQIKVWLAFSRSFAVLGEKKEHNTCCKFKNGDAEHFGFFSVQILAKSSSSQRQKLQPERGRKGRREGEKVRTY